MFREALALAEADASSDLYETIRRNLATTLFNVAKQLAHNPFEDQRDPERALELANEAVALYPEVGMYRAGIGHALYRLGRYAEAAEAMESGFRMGGVYEQAELGLRGAILWNLDRRDAAETRYHADANNGSEFKESSERGGISIFTLLVEFEEKLGPEYDDQRADSLRQLGRSLRAAGRLEDAVYFYRQSEELLAVCNRPDRNPASSHHSRRRRFCTNDPLQATAWCMRPMCVWLIPRRPNVGTHAATSSPPLPRASGGYGASGEAIRDEGRSKRGGPQTRSASRSELATDSEPEELLAIDECLENLPRRIPIV